MDAGIDHQASRPERLHLQHAQPLVFVLVQPHLVGEALGVQSPSLARGGSDEFGSKAAKGGAVGRLLLDGDLEVMPRVGFVIGGGGEAVPRTQLGVLRVDVVDGRPRPVGGSRHVMLQDVVLPGRIDRLHPAVVRGQATEETRGGLPPSPHLFLGQSNDLLARGECVSPALGQMSDCCLGVGGAHSTSHVAPLFLDSCELLAALFVDLLGAEGQGGPR